MATVRATLADGTVLTDQPQGGFWLIASVGQPGTNLVENPNVLVEALDAQGIALESGIYPAPPP